MEFQTCCVSIIILFTKPKYHLKFFVHSEENIWLEEGRKQLVYKNGLSIYLLN